MPRIPLTDRELIGMERLARAFIAEQDMPAAERPAGCATGRGVALDLIKIVGLVRAANVRADAAHGIAGFAEGPGHDGRRRA